MIRHELMCTRSSRCSSVINTTTWCLEHVALHRRSLLNFVSASYSSSFGPLWLWINKKIKFDSKLFTSLKHHLILRHVCEFPAAKPSQPFWRGWKELIWLDVIQVSCETFSNYLYLRLYYSAMQLRRCACVWVHQITGNVDNLPACTISTQDSTHVCAAPGLTK